jgi:hypothetical protein
LVDWRGAMKDELEGRMKVENGRWTMDDEGRWLKG